MMTLTLTLTLTPTPTFLPLVLACALAGIDAEGFFGRHDQNRDGKITKEELGDAELFAALDRDKSGHLDLREVRQVVRSLSADLVGRLVDVTAAWQHALDGADPALFDRDGDGALERRELASMLFDQLDLDQNGQLDQDELVLLPYEVQVASPTKGKTTIARADFNIPKEALLALDRDRDGKISTDEYPWPRPLPLVPLVVRDLSDFWRSVDRDNDEKLEKRELPGRADLFKALDGKKQGYLTLVMLKATRGDDIFDTARRTDDHFLARYDLNGDGVVTPDEFAGPRAFFARIDRNGDGKYDRADRPGAKDKAAAPKAAKKWGRG